MMVEKCHKCGKRSQIYLGHMQPYCNRCFSGIIEQRIRKALKGQIRPDQRIICGDKALREAISRSVKMPLKLKASGTGTRVVKWFMDNEVDAFFGSFTGKRVKVPEGLLAFRSVSIDEMDAYCRINRLRFTAKRPDVFLISATGKTHPSMLYSAYRAMARMDELGIKVTDKPRKR